MGNPYFTIATTDKNTGKIVSGPVMKEIEVPLRGIVIPFNMGEGQEYSVEIVFSERLIPEKE